MSLFFKEDYEKLDAKIADLEHTIDITYTLISSGSDEEWQEITDLIKEIHEDFKSIRYPTKIDRDTAWQTFFEIRQDAYDKKQKRFEYLSKNHRDELLDMINPLEYWALREGLRQMFGAELSEIRDEVIENQKKLKEARQHFSSVKYQMTGDHKYEVHTRIVEVQESHDQFWEEYKDRRQELQEAKEERKRDWEERQERKENAKNKLIENVENNKEKLEKAEGALAKMQAHKEDLEDKIDNAYNDSFREKCEGWLDELNDRIENTEQHIEKLKGWIEDGEDRLRDWR